MSFTIGQRVQLHPATDRWMMGDRYGVIESTHYGPRGEYVYRVKLDKSGKTLPFLASNVLEVVS